MSSRSSIKKIALILAGLFAAAVLVVVGLAASKPDTLHVERSLAMRAAPEHVFPYANDFHKFTTWIPWTELDPSQTVEFSEPSAGVGAWYTWSGNDEVGTGRMELLSAAPNEVVHELRFIEPFESVATATVSVRELDGETVEVTWAYDQDADFATKLMTVFVDMDAMLGADFDKGLAKLKPLVEADASAGS